MEKPQLVNFIAKVLEDGGFKVYKNFKTSQQIIDIYAILPTSMGDFGMVVACKNYDKEWEVGIDVLKEMEVIGKKLKSSKVCVVTSSGFSSQAKRYASERKIKLVDRNDLVSLAKKYNAKKKREKQPARLQRERPADISSESFYNRDLSLEYIDDESNYISDYDREYNRVYNPYDSYAEYEEDISNYEREVGGVDLTGYSEYDDDLYREEFLNKYSDDDSAYQTRLIPNNHSPLESTRVNRSSPSRSQNISLNSIRNRRNTLNYNNQPSRSGFLSKSDSLVGNYAPKNTTPFGNILKPLLSNTVVAIIVVVLISYLLAFLLDNIVKVPTGYLGLTELIVSLVLSYGIVMYSDKNADIIVKGTTIFFVSLVILMVLLIAL